MRWQTLVNHQDVLVADFNLWIASAGGMLIVVLLDRRDVHFFWTNGIRRPHGSIGWPVGVNDRPFELLGFELRAKQAGT